MPVASAPRWIAAAFLFLSAMVLQADGGPGFRRIRDTLSPNGAYVFAWGWGVEENEDPKKLKEWPPKRDSEEGDIQNYLVDAVKGRVLMVFGEGGAYYLTSDGRFSRSGGLDVVWSDDSRRALALYDEKYGESSVLWIDPAKRTAPGIGEQLKEMTGKHIIKAEKLPEDEELLSFWFSFGVILPDDVFVVDVTAKHNARSENEHYYRFKVKVKPGESGPECTLIEGRKIPEAENYFEMEDEKARMQAIEKDLNEVYNRYRAKLSDAEKNVLKERQLRWLKKRAATDEHMRDVLTVKRIAYLRAWAER